ncbi:unnamed protein product [Phytophthora fragariaefolia]|uniref:Unnamed protein product n=1 Tax=Phytophthora fragariaefolia TaxID=1490495 RepID=A0A9W6WWE6_9STRA|nr:unnamed protein product [Phytophthora fragariaefolia]
MMSYLYKNASSSSDYQDAELLGLLWYLFGRASNLSLVRKPNLSVDAAEVFVVRFIRMNTSEEQGLSLFPDADFTTCPLHAIATALITQTAPSVALIDNLPEIPVGDDVTLTPATPPGGGAEQPRQVRRAYRHRKLRSLLLVHRSPSLPYRQFTPMSTGCLNASRPQLEL